MEALSVFLFSVRGNNTIAIERYRRFTDYDASGRTFLFHFSVHFDRKRKKKEEKRKKERIAIVVRYRGKRGRWFRFCRMTRLLSMGRWTRHGRANEKREIRIPRTPRVARTRKTNCTSTQVLTGDTVQRGDDPVR